MPITFRPGIWKDIRSSLAIQPRLSGGAVAGGEAALQAWRQMTRGSFFISVVIEANPPIGGTRLIGLVAAVFVSPGFADSEIADLRPDMNSRIVAGVCSGRSVLATRDEVAQANAGCGVDVLVLFGSWRDEVLTSEERSDLQTLYASSFAECLAGHRIRRILYESVDEPSRTFAEQSGVYQTVARFPELGRTIFLMTRESAKAIPASIGNMMFRYSEPVLRLRDSDQQLLLAALCGATDAEIAAEIGITTAAVKARWRSTFERIEEGVPCLVSGEDADGTRGKQKRHRVLAYVRAHPEELRPNDLCAFRARTSARGSRSLS